MNEQRRNLSILTLSLISAGCVPTSMKSVLLKKDEEQKFNVEDLYSSKIFGSSSNNFYSSSNYYNAELSEKAYKIFDTIFTKNIMPRELPIPTEKQTASATKLVSEIQTKYQGKTALELNETYDAMKSIVPTLRMYVDISSINEKEIKTNKPLTKVNIKVDNEGTITIPPGYMVILNQKGYCLDGHLPAPQKGEKLTMLPSESLIPNDLMPLYKAIQLKAYNDKSYRNDMQNIMWTLRDVGKPNGLVTNLDSTVAKQITQVMPNGVNILKSVHKSELEKAGLTENSSTKNDPKKIFDSFLGNLLGNANPVETAKDKVEYQMLTPTIAAYSIATGELTVKNVLANTGTTPYTINMADWVMKPVSNVQHVSMYPTTKDNITAIEYQVGTSPEDLSLYEKAKNAVTSNYENAMRFANGAILKQVPKVLTFGDYAMRLLKNTPVAKKVLESTPYIGNALCLYESVSGKNWLTGANLNAFERTAACIGTIPGGSLLKFGLKEKMVNFTGMAFSGAGFATNVGVMQKDITAYAKTFTTPIDFSTNSFESSIQNTMKESMAKMSESTTLNIEQRNTIKSYLKEIA